MTDADRRVVILTIDDLRAMTDGSIEHGSIRIHPDANAQHFLKDALKEPAPSSPTDVAEARALSELWKMLSEVLTDRELDTWLAEHLFGWAYYPCVLPNAREAFWRSPDGEHHTDCVPDSYGLIPLSYTATGDGMLLVLEAMRKREWLFSVEEYGDDGPHQCVEFSREIDDKGAVMYAPSGALPRAVALAAKAALEAGGAQQ